MYPIITNNYKNQTKTVKKPCMSECFLYRSQQPDEFMKTISLGCRHMFSITPNENAWLNAIFSELRLLRASRELFASSINILSRLRVNDVTARHQRGMHCQYDTPVMTRCIPKWQWLCSRSISYIDNDILRLYNMQFIFLLS